MGLILVLLKLFRSTGITGTISDFHWHDENEWVCENVWEFQLPPRYLRFCNLLRVGSQRRSKEFGVSGPRPARPGHPAAFYKPQL